jgi:IS605 OrfB family transposase
LQQECKETLPIELGRWHFWRFFREGNPTFSQVLTDGEEIYIFYSFRFRRRRDPHEPTGDPVLGVDLGERVAAAYSAVSQTGEVLEEGASEPEALRRRLQELNRKIDAAQSKGRDPRPLWEKRKNVASHATHRISNQIVEVAARHGAAIVFEDLEGLGGGRALMRRQFHRLKRQVRYKAEEEGLWAEVEVYPGGTSTTCPICGHRDAENRGGPSHPELGRAEFGCQECGHEAHSDLNAARMIGTRALWRLNGGTDTGFQSAAEYARHLTERRGALT